MLKMLWKRKVALEAGQHDCFASPRLSLHRLHLTFFTGILLGFAVSYNHPWAVNQLLFKAGPPPVPSYESPNLSNAEDFRYHDDDRVADIIKKRVRVLCVVNTTPKNHETRAKEVKATWGRRCSALLFTTSKKDSSLPAIVLPVAESRDNLWTKARAGFLELYKHHLNDADWFLKTDDDTYVILENLRYFLLDKDASKPVYYGCRFKPNRLDQTFMSGGAGYVLSREAVRRLVERGIPNIKYCRNISTFADDFELGRCLEMVGVKAGDSRDAAWRARFLPLSPQAHLAVDGIREEKWLWQYSYYPLHRDRCCKNGYKCLCTHRRVPASAWFGFSSTTLCKKERRKLCCAVVIVRRRLGCRLCYALAVREPRWKLDRANWDKYQVRAVFPDDVLEDKSVEEANEAITSIITETAAAAISQTPASLPRRCKLWWNEDCKQDRCHLREAAVRSVSELLPGLTAEEAPALHVCLWDLGVHSLLDHDYVQPGELTACLILLEV